MKSGLGWCGAGLGVLVILATLIPVIRSDQWWIRIFDFPRLQLAILAVASIVLVLIGLPRKRITRPLLILALLAATVYQVAAIVPYTPFQEVEVERVEACSPEDRLSVVVSNLEIDNRESELAVRLFARIQPDLLLVMETDEWWLERLKLIEDQYPYRVKEPRDGPWGMALYSRLELVDPKVRYITDDYVPSIWTGIRLRSGKEIEFYGVHPKPPKPPWDTDHRDAELLTIGREVRERKNDAIVAGDLNDVAWSRTTREFQERSGLLDPRIGRGLFATFSAEVPWLLRWPLDHVFIEEGFSLLSLRLLSDVNSDHFPLFIQICTVEAE